MDSLRATADELLRGAGPSEAFKSRGDDHTGMESIILDEDDEMLAPAVVVATIALIGVFAVGLLYQTIGLAI